MAQRRPSIFETGYPFPCEKRLKAVICVQAHCDTIAATHITDPFLSQGVLIESVCCAEVR